MTNYFQSFDLRPHFEIDHQLLDARYEQLMQLCHPDKFASASAPEQRMAAKRAADINQAYGVLTHPVARAGHLLELQGVDLAQLERQPASPDFLFEQMMLRERVQGLTDLTDDALTVLIADIETGFATTQARFICHYETGDLEAASSSWVEFHFQQKLSDELGRAQSQQG